MTSLSMQPRLSPPVQKVRLDDIDFDNDCFRMSFEPDLERLIQSMDTVGLINPTVLRGNAEYHIISGYRRTAAAKALGWDTIDARVYASSEITNESALKLAFFENVGTRTLNLIEAGAAAGRFVEAEDSERPTVLKTILPLMGFQPGKKVLQQLLSLSNLIKEWKSYVVSKGLALANAAKVARLSQEEQVELFQVLSPLKLSHNKMSQCLDMLQDIKIREGVSLAKIIETADLNVIASDPNRTATEKTTLFRRALHKRRYPAFTRTEERFQETRRKLSLPPVVRLDPPHFFEGNRLTLSGSFRSVEELAAIVSALQTAAESEALEEMFDLL